mgnify:CR=1 FL=1
MIPQVIRVSAAGVRFFPKNLGALAPAVSDEMEITISAEAIKG